LGEEILSPLPGKGRVLQIQVDLVTLRGQLAEDLLTAKRVPLRALTLSILSELTVEEATAADASQMIAEKLKQAVNATLRPKNGVTPVQQVLIKKYYVQ
jgi:flagellar basal body-associated protein FliL